MIVENLFGKDEWEKRDLRLSPFVHSRVTGTESWRRIASAMPDIAGKQWHQQAAQFSQSWAWLIRSAATVRSHQIELPPIPHSSTVRVLVLKIK